ncbi:6-hydroxymethylpterin diphosphokinase MptE-like protein [Lysinibacillus irui]|uniref:motility associated factor glycosyltransferase family protein n=1 Tax=Lysinibacillus irui TaxID=2998077 RepID=UPI003D298098
MFAEKNIGVLTKNQFHWIASLTEDVIHPTFMDKKSDLEEIFQTRDDGLIRLKDEIDDKFKLNPLKKEVIFVFGINSIIELEWINTGKHKDSVMVIIEPNPTFFSYVLSNKDLRHLFKNDNVLLFVDDKIENLNLFLQGIFYEFKYLQYLKNTSVYFTYFYRNFELDKTKSIVTILRQVIATLLFSIGTDIEDNLIGLERNISNLPYIKQSKDITKFKNIYNGLPAIIVAAGPSLNKNIQEIRNAKAKAIIIAVDTIVKRLLEEGITPDFVCSIERVSEVYDYFYKDLDLPITTAIVGSPVLDSRIFENTKSPIIIPFRQGVEESRWMQKMLKLPSETAISMGYSCANLAFSIAHHLGCSPIVFVGQDLAFGKDTKETHASGTKYDEQLSANVLEPSIEWTDGYHDNQVKTTKIWLQFKLWFEQHIAENSIFAINATEGGARINYTKQMSLEETIEKYCVKEVPSISGVIEKIKLYSIDSVRLVDTLNKEIKLYTKIKQLCESYLKNLELISIKEIKNIKNTNNTLEEFHKFLSGIIQHPLLLHNLQSIFLQYYWKYNSREQIIDVEYIREEIYEQKKFLVTIIDVIDRIVTIISKPLSK